MRLPSLRGGYSLDLDSTRLLHEDGHQEGVSVGHTRMGNKPCLHPLLAVIEEAKLVAGFWLRAGNTACAVSASASSASGLTAGPSCASGRGLAVAGSLRAAGHGSASAVA